VKLLCISFVNVGWRPLALSDLRCATFGRLWFVSGAVSKSPSRDRHADLAAVGPRARILPDLLRNEKALRACRLVIAPLPSCAVQVSCLELAALPWTAQRLVRN